MSLEEYQKEVDEWTSQWEPQYWVPHRILGQMQEELGEVAKIINAVYGDRVPKEGEKVEDLGDELCDLLFAIICMANSKGVDLNKTWRERMDKKFERDKDRFEKKD